MEEALVSIIMPSFNGAKYIAASIDSIISQTYKNWELIITDDCSNDGTQAIIKSYASRDTRIRSFFFDKNQGSGATRNKSIEEARGRYIAFCDSDDRWLPEKLDFLYKFAVAIVHPNYNCYNLYTKNTMHAPMDYQLSLFGTGLIHKSDEVRKKTKQGA